MENANNTFPVVLITGPRQVGKTTILEHNLSLNRQYITLDDPQIRSLANTDPSLFFQTYEPPILIDEIQYAPELFPYIKMIVDRKKQKGLFWLTGSQQFHLMKNITESLAGRVAILNLQGLSQCEKLQRKSETFTTELKKIKLQMNVKEIYEYILRGSFPALFADKNMSWKLFYDSYLKTYIERNIRSILNVSSEHDFLKFLCIIAARTGQLINYSEVSKEVRVSVNTVKSWISVLETSGLIYLLQPYSSNYISRTVKTPKLYFLDTGLCCYLSGWETVETLSNGAMSGAILETYVFSEIIKSYWHNGKSLKIYFYRDLAKREIDFLIEENDTFYPIEVKKTASPVPNDVKNFSILEDAKLNIGKGAVICFSNNSIPLDKDVNIIPVPSL
ncbi:MAG: ATP-binding protein [Christensenellaceae bacterium]|nr:ATP-binding protein [Christensenellaceae bacterium]